MEAEDCCYIRRKPEQDVYYRPGRSFQISRLSSTELDLQAFFGWQGKNVALTEEFKNDITGIYQQISQAMNETNSFNRNGACYAFDLSHIFLDYDQETFVDLVHVNNEGNRYIEVISTAN